MGKPFGSALELKALTTPSGNPPSGAVLLYFKADGKLYKKESSGTETLVEGGGGGGPHTHAAADIASGTFDITRIPTGATSSTVSLGDHTHANYVDTSSTQSVGGAKTFTSTMTVDRSTGRTSRMDGERIWVAHTDGTEGNLYDWGLELRTRPATAGAQSQSTSIGTWTAYWNGSTSVQQSSGFGISASNTDGGDVTWDLTASSKKSRLHADAIRAKGFSGATSTARWVGATTTGAPVSGTFAAGDWVVAQDGQIWICTSAGSPGTWASAGAVSSVAGKTGAVTLAAADIASGTFDITRIPTGTTSSTVSLGNHTHSNYIRTDQSTTLGLGVGTTWRSSGGGRTVAITDAEILVTGPQSSPSPMIRATAPNDGHTTLQPNHLFIEGGVASAGDPHRPASLTWTCYSWSGSQSLEYTHRSRLIGPNNGHPGANTATLFFAGNGSTSQQTILQAGKLSTQTPAWVTESGAMSVVGLPGANGTLSRWVGSTASGAPASGTFLVGDFIITRDGKLWVCTAGGTPGTWVNASAGDVSSDTTQTITGAKTFSAPITGTRIATPSVPAAGNSQLYFKTDGHLYSQHPAGGEAPHPPLVVSATAPTNPKTGDLWVEQGVVPTYSNGVTLDTTQTITGEKTFTQDAKMPGLDLTTDYTSTQPPTPATGVTLFARNKARRLLSVVGPSGLDTPYQPGLFNNRIARIQAINNTAAPSTEGIVVTNVGTAAAVSNATTNFYAAMVRYRIPSAATANAACGTRSSTAQWFVGNTANMGGFFMVSRFGFNQTQTNSRFFCGFSSTTGALAAGTEPSALLNLFGLAFDSTDTNWQFITNGGSGTATKIDLGTSVGAPRTAATNFYEFRMFCPSGNATQVFYSLERLNDGVLVQGDITLGAKSPAANTLLSYHLNLVNNTAATVSVDVQSIYIENDN